MLQERKKKYVDDSKDVVEVGGGQENEEGTLNVLDARCIYSLILVDQRYQSGNNLHHSKNRRR